MDTNNGTNTGDGIRVALRQLKADTTANTKKYIILMTDGEPSYYMYNSNNISGVTTWTPYNAKVVAHGYYTTLGDNGYQIRGGVGADKVTVSGQLVSADDYLEQVPTKTHGRSYYYAETMCDEIKNAGSDYSSFEIGYSTGASATKTQNLATAAGGKYYSALDATSMDNVLHDISNQIKDSFTIENVNLNFILPDGLEYTGSMANVTINGNQYTQKLPDIVYRLNSDKKYYIADYFYITFRMKSTKTGSSSLPQSASLTYTELDETTITINNAIQPITYNVTDALPNITAAINPINPQNPNSAGITQNIALSYKVNADSFSFYSNPVYQADPKDVIFVVDTSIGMSSDQLTNVKNGLYDKVTNNSAIQNARYGLVTFNSAATDDYILEELTNNASNLQSKIFSITSSSSDSTRDIGNAMEHAKTIFSNYGRTDSRKYLVLIGTGDVTCTDEQLKDIKSSNYNIITVNLGYITPPSKVNNQVVAGAVEPNNNIKALHYNLIGKQDNGDNILQKADNNYFLNIDYSHVTNTSNPNEFFTIFENSQNMNNQNEVVNSVLPKVSAKIENGTAQVQQQTYTFNSKLKFKTQGNFNIISGLNPSTDTEYDAETPQFDVQYNFDSNSGQYVLNNPIDDRVFTIKIKNGIDPTNLRFGPGIVSYLGFQLSNNIDPYTLNLKSTVQIQNFGLYKGILNNQPNILESDQPLSLKKGSNISLGATLTGWLNSNTDIKLEIPNGLALNGDINVYSYDDSGNLTKIGTMIQSASDTSKITYKYSSTQDIVNKKILILYDESLGNTANKDSIYINSLYTPDQNKHVQIKMADEPLQIKQFGLYKGILNNEPSILESDQSFNITKGANIRLGATLTGSINNNTDVKLEIQNGLTLNGDINVYSYDDSGNLTKIGIMIQSGSDTSTITYKYNSVLDVVNKKILILYNENIDSNANLDTSYVNTLYTPDGDNKKVEIKITNNLPELF